MKILPNFKNEWCTFDKQKGCSNLKTLFDDCILSVLCAWKDFKICGRSRSLANKYNCKKKQ
jgi:hypothetical protein